jgi:hypothetical protein
MKITLMKKRTSGFTKWWWLGYFTMATWTSDERSARLALGFIVSVIIMPTLFVVDALLELFGVERHIAAILAGLLPILPGFYAARPIAAVLYPDLLRRADANAAKRLSSTADDIK